MRVALEPGAIAPRKAHEHDAGYDIFVPFNVTVPYHGKTEVDTGIHVEIPVGYDGHIRSRSSLFRKGIIADGTIDTDYTGEVRVTLWNVGPGIVEIPKGTAIAQLVLERISDDSEVEVVELEAFGETERGNNGFGSTDRQRS